MKRARCLVDCKAELVPLKGTVDKGPIIINKPEFLIGRSATASYIIKDLRVSRTHCCLRFVEGSWEIRDQSSLGIVVNGEKLKKNEPHALKSGDVVNLVPDSSFNYMFGIVENTSDPNLKKRCISPPPPTDYTKADEKSSLSHKEKQLRLKIQQTQHETSVMENEHSQLEADLQNGLEMIDKRYEAEQASLMCRSASHEDRQKFEEEKAALEQQFRQEKEELESLMKAQMEGLQKKISEKQLVELRLTLENQQLQEALEKERNLFRERLEKEEEQVQLERRKVQELVQQHQETIASMEEDYTIAGLLQEKEMAEKYEEERKTIQSALLEKEKALEVTEERLKKEGEIRDKFQDVLESELQCSICSELFVCAITLNCTHTFCELCISQWKERKKDCPVCRAKITSETRMLVLDGFIDKAVENLSDDLKTRRAEIVEEKKKAMLAYQQKASSSTAVQKSTRNTRQSTRGRRTSNRGRRTTASAVVASDVEDGSIYISSEEDAISLSDTDSDSSLDGDPSEYYGGYGYCFRCGRRGHWARGCPNY